MKNNFLYRTFSSCKFALGVGWKISKKRVILEFLQWIFMYMDWLMVSCVLIRFILDMVMKRTSFEKMMLYVWSVVALESLLIRLVRWICAALRTVSSITST